MNEVVAQLEMSFRNLMAATEAPARVQHRLLLSLLQRNAEVKYGRDCDFRGVRSMADYRSRVPVITYDQIAIEIERIHQGVGNALFAGKCLFFAKTSGTTGKPKIIPFPESVREEYQSFIGPMLFALNQQVPGALEYGFCLSGKYLEERSPEGVPAGQSTAFVRRLYSDCPYFAAAPEDVFEETNHELRYFLLGAFGLARSVRVISSLNPSTLLTLFKSIEKNLPSLISNFRAGRLVDGPAGFEKFADLFAALAIGKEPVAERLATALSAKGQLILERVWPELQVIQTWQGGSARHYLDSLREYGPRCTLWPMVSGSTEAALLVPLSADETGGIPALCSTIFEFVKEDADPRQGPYLEAEELEVNGTYRAIVTNSRGLYRFAMEDVFTVTGFRGRAPILSFLHRVGNTSSLTGEKLTEKDISHALGAAQKATPVKVRAFQAAPEWGTPPRYVFLVELAEINSDSVLTKFASAFEDGLWSANTEYEAKRQSGRLAPLLLCVLEPGELERIKGLKAKATGRSDVQLKVPVLNRELVDLSQFNVRAKFSSR